MRSFTNDVTEPLLGNGTSLTMLMPLQTRRSSGRVGSAVQVDMMEGRDNDHR